MPRGRKKKKKKKIRFPLLPIFTFKFYVLSVSMFVSLSDCAWSVSYSAADVFYDISAVNMSSCFIVSVGLSVCLFV